MEFIDSGFHFCASKYSSNLFGGRTPVPIRTNKNIIDIAIGVYEKRNRTHISLIKVEILENNNNLKFQLKEASINKALINKGKHGTYSEWGVVPSCSVDLGDKYGLYTIGFDSRNESIFHASTGLAYLDKNLKIINKSIGPVLDRGPLDPFWAASPFVYKKEEEFYMFYTSAYDYKFIDSIGKKHHLYNIKLRVSNTPEYFSTKSETIVSGRNCLEYAIARPCCIDLDGEDYLFYCKRESEFSKDYMIFYEKLNPNRKEIAKSNDNFLNIKYIDNLDFKKCQCYPYLIKYSKYVILFYNGSNYGKSGFRIAYKEI